MLACATYIIDGLIKQTAKCWMSRQMTAVNYLLLRLIFIFSCDKDGVGKKKELEITELIKICCECLKVTWLKVDYEFPGLSKLVPLSLLHSLTNALQNTQTSRGSLTA